MYDYPEDINNIKDILVWFHNNREKYIGKGIKSSSFSRFGGNIKSFIKKNELSLEEYTTLLWGVLNEKEKTYSPVYSHYFLDKLPQYKQLKEKYLNQPEKKETNIEFDNSVLEEEESDPFEGL